MGNSHSVHKENAARPGNDLGRNIDSRCRNESPISACDDEVEDFNFVHPTKKKPGFLKRLKNRFRKRESSVQTPVSPPCFTPLQDLVSPGDLTPSTDAECVTNQQPTGHVHTGAVDHSCNTILHTKDTVFAQSEEDAHVSCGNDTPISYNDVTPIPSTDVNVVTRDDVTSGSSDDNTPVQHDDVTLVHSDDNTLVQEENVRPVPSDDDTPVEQDDVTHVPSDDTAPVQHENVTPVPSDDATPVQQDDVKPVPSDDNTPVQHDDVASVSSNDNPPVQHDDVTHVPSDENTHVQRDVTPVPSDDNTPVQHDDVTPVPSDDNTPVQHNDATTVSSDDNTTVPHDDAVSMQYDVISQVHCTDVADKHHDANDTSVIHKDVTPMLHTDDAPMLHTDDVPMHIDDAHMLHNDDAPMLHTDDAPMMYKDDARVPCHYEVGCSYRQGDKDASETDPGQSQNNNPAETDPGQSQNNNPAEKEESRIIVSDNLGKDPSGKSNEYREDHVSDGEAGQARKRNVFTGLIGKFFRRKKWDAPDHVTTPRARFEQRQKVHVLTNILGNGGGLHGDTLVCSRGCQTDSLLSPEIGGNIFTQQAIYGCGLYPPDEELCFNRQALGGYGSDRCAQIADQFKNIYDWRREFRKVGVGHWCGQCEELKHGCGNIPAGACMDCYQQHDASGQSHHGEAGNPLDCRYRLVFNIGGQQFDSGGQFQFNDIGCPRRQAKGCCGHQMQCANESVHQMQGDGKSGRRSPSGNVGCHSRGNNDTSVRQSQTTYKCCCLRQTGDGCNHMRRTHNRKGRQLHGVGNIRTSDYGSVHGRQPHDGNSPQMQSDDGGGQPRQTDDGCRRFRQSSDGNSRQSQTEDTDSRQRQDVDGGLKRPINDGCIQKQTDDGVVHQGQIDDGDGQQTQFKYGDWHPMQADVGDSRHMLPNNGVGNTNEGDCQRQTNDVDELQRQTNDGCSPHRQASGGSGRNNGDGRHRKFIDHGQDNRETLQKCRDEGQCQNVTGTGSRHMYVDVDGRCNQQGGDGGDRFKRIASSSVPCDDENKNNGSIQGNEYLADKDVPAVVSHYPNKNYQNKNDQAEMEYQFIETKKYGSLEHIKVIKLENQAKARRLQEIQAKVQIDRSGRFKTVIDNAKNKDSGSNGQRFKQRHNWTVISDCHSPGGNREQADDINMFDAVGSHHQRANDSDRYLPQEVEGLDRYEKNDDAVKDDLLNDESYTNWRNNMNERIIKNNQKYKLFGQIAMLYPLPLDIQTKVVQAWQTRQRNCSYSISNGNKEVDDDEHDYDAVGGQLDDYIGDQHDQINDTDSDFLQKDKSWSETRDHSIERKIYTTPKENYKYENGQSKIKCPSVETKKFGSLEHMKMIKLQNHAKNKRLKQVQTKVAKTWQTPKQNYSYSTSNDNINVDSGHVNDECVYHHNKSENNVDHGSQNIDNDDSRYLQQNEESVDKYDHIDKSYSDSLQNDESWTETQTNLKQIKTCTTLSDNDRFENDQSEMRYPPVETKKYGSLEHMKMIKLQNQAKNKRLKQVQTKVAKTWHTPQKNYSYTLSNDDKQVDDKHGYDVVGGHAKIDYDDSRYLQQDENIKDQQLGNNNSESLQDDGNWPETPGNSKLKTACATLSENYNYENDQSEIQCPPVETKKYGSLEHMKMIKLQNQTKNKRLKQVQTKVAQTWQTQKRNYSHSLLNVNKQVDDGHGYGPTGDQYNFGSNGSQCPQQDDNRRDRYYHTDNDNKNDDNWTDRRICSKEINNFTNHNESFKYGNNQSTVQYPPVETKRYGSLEHMKMIKMQNQAKNKRLKQVQTKVAQTWQTPKRNYSYSLSNVNKEVYDGRDYDNAGGHHTLGNNECRYLQQDDDIGDRHEEIHNTERRVLQNEVTIGNDSSERCNRTNFSERYKYKDHQSPIQCPSVETKKYGSLEHMKMIKLQNQTKNKRLKQVQTKVAQTWQTPQRNYSYSLSNVNKQVNDQHGYDVIGGNNKLDYNEGQCRQQDGRYEQNDYDSESVQNYGSWADRGNHSNERNNRTNQHGSYKNDQQTVQNHPVETKTYGSLEHMKMIKMQNEAKNKRLNQVQTKVAQTWQTPQRDYSYSLSHANQITQNPQNNHYGSVSHYKSAQQNNSTLKRNLAHARSRINTWNTNTRASKVTPAQVRRPQEPSLSKSVPQGPFRRPDQTNKSPWSRTVAKGNHTTAQKGKVVQAITSSGMIYNTYTCI